MPKTQKEHPISGNGAFFQKHAQNFLDNERTVNVIQRQCIVPRSKLKLLIPDSEQVGKSTAHQMDSQINSGASALKNGHSNNELIKEVEYRVENGPVPKRYKITCYLKPQTIPVRYTESVSLSVRPINKHTKTFSSMTVHNENKGDESTPIFTSTLEIPIARDQYNYIPLDIPVQS